MIIQVTWSGDIADNGTQITVASNDANFYDGASLITCTTTFWF